MQRERKDWIEPKHVALPLMRQCELAGVSSATVYCGLDAMVRRQHEDQQDNELPPHRRGIHQPAVLWQQGMAVFLCG